MMVRCRTAWRSVLMVSIMLGAAALAYLLHSGSASANCPTGCDYCSADPVFVQPDLRKPEMIERIRKAKARGAVVVEKRGMVVTIE